MIVDWISDPADFFVKAEPLQLFSQKPETGRGKISFPVWLEKYLQKKTYLRQ